MVRVGKFVINWSHPSVVKPMMGIVVEPDGSNPT